jgi:predicted nucleic acid-binding protein
VTLEPALLDANVPMYAAGQEHPYKEPCVWVMTEVAEGRLAVAIDTEIVQEVLYRYGAIQRWDIAVTMATTLLDLAPAIYPVLEADARLAIGLFARYGPQGLPARDVLHVAVMHNNALTHIISTDAHFDRVEGVTRLDPLELYRARQPT